MKVLILEDEYHAAKRISRLLRSYIEDLDIVATIDSVSDAVKLLKSVVKIDLIFADIQLADGLSFSIFAQVDVDIPVIFTTAFDQYTLKAFKLNSIDYLLKPIVEIELQAALKKYHRLSHDSRDDTKSMLQVLSKMTLNQQYKERFLIKNKDQYIFLLNEEIAYFYSEESLTFVVTRAGKAYIYEETLTKIDQELDPKVFHKINRKQIVRINSIDKIHNYFNNRVKLEVLPKSSREFIVSRDKAKDFKNWLGG